MLCKDGGLNEKLGIYIYTTGWKQFNLDLFIPVNGEVEWISQRNTPKLL